MSLFYSAPGGVRRPLPGCIVFALAPLNPRHRANDDVARRDICTSRFASAQGVAKAPRFGKATGGRYKIEIYRLASLARVAK